MAAPVLLLAVFGGFPADPPPGADRLAELQAILADPERPDSDRHAAAAEARRLRPEALAAAGPDDLDAPTWALDQAAAELAAVGSDGADLAVLFGLPTDRQRQAVQRAATEAEALIRAAETRIERLLAQAEGAAGLDDARSRALRRLRDDEAGLRAPYYRARAAVLLAGVRREAGDGATAISHARAALEAVSITEAIDPVAETARQVTGAIAAHFAGDRSAARQALHRVVRPGGAPPGPDEIDAHTHAEALLALASVQASAQGPEAAVGWLLGRLDDAPFRSDAADGEGGAQSDPLLIVLAHDAAARLLISAEEPRREPAVNIAMRLLDRDDLGLDDQQRRALVGARLDRLLASAPGAADYPPRVVILWALHAAGDPDRRVEAIAFLRSAAERTEDPALHELARFEAAALLLDPAADDAERASGIQLLISMLQERSDWPRAASAAGAATAHARALLAAAPDDPDRRDLLERALRAAIAARSGREADPWRLDLARLLVSAAPLSPIDPRFRPDDDRYTEALALLERIDPDSDAAAPARTLAQALHLRSIEAARAADPRLAEEAARRALLWARTHRSPLEGRFRLELAEILLDRKSGSEAKAQLLAIPDGGAGLPGGRPRIRLNLARARLLTGGDAEAFQDLVDLAATLDAPPPTSSPTSSPTSRPARSDAFWEAWALILEILERQNEGGQRTQAMRAHILRLRSIDPDLGSAPWQGHIEAIEARLPP